MGWGFKVLGSGYCCHSGFPKPHWWPFLFDGAYARPAGPCAGRACAVVHGRRRPGPLAGHSPDFLGRTGRHDCGGTGSRPTGPRRRHRRRAADVAGDLPQGAGRGRQEAGIVWHAGVRGVFLGSAGHRAEGALQESAALGVGPRRTQGDLVARRPSLSLFSQALPARISKPYIL